MPGKHHTQHLLNGQFSKGHILVQEREVRAREVKGDGKELLDAHIPLRGPCHMSENLLFRTNGSSTFAYFYQEENLNLPLRLLNGILIVSCLAD